MILTDKLEYELAVLNPAGDRIGYPRNFENKPKPGSTLDKMLSSILPGGKYNIDELNKVFGTNLEWITKKILSDTESKKITLQHGIAGMAALFDTREPPLQTLHPALALKALQEHPGHYNAAAVATGLRRDVLPYAFTGFQDKYNFYKNASGGDVKFQLRHAQFRRLQILSEPARSKRVLVRIVSTRDRFWQEGYINKTDIVRPNLARFPELNRKLRLVFVQNTERIGTDMFKIQNALTINDTTFRLRSDPRKKAKLKKNTFISLPDNSGHLATEYLVRAFVFNDWNLGYIKKTDVGDDIDRRSLQRGVKMIPEARAGATMKKAVFVDIRGGRCATQAWPIEYFTGHEIVNGIRTASLLAGRKVDEIYIVSHGNSNGISGTGNLHDMFGIYRKKSKPDITPGGLTTTAFASQIKDYITDSFRIWLLGCKTAAPGDDPSFAEELGDEIRNVAGGTSFVAGLVERGDVGRGFEQKEKFVIFPGGTRQFMPAGEK